MSSWPARSSSTCSTVRPSASAAPSWLRDFSAFGESTTGPSRAWRSQCFWAEVMTLPAITRRVVPCA
ncbi:hypothetical protein ACIRD3_18895 [Kitasatospora sp. NPDC093550]|uniref:hypothetical protein n=1 Tax=Kitasatospora sp. NPDC093550 TaxID=3364089 RepID=UPI003826FBAD